METENGVFVEDERGTMDKTNDKDSVVNEKQDGLFVGNGEKAVGDLKVDEEKSADVPECKTLDKGGKVGANDKATSKGRVPLASNTSRGLSQSISFPARGVRPDLMKKSIDGLLVKNKAQATRANGPKNAGKNVNESVSVSILKPVNRRASSSMTLKENGSGESSRRTTIVSVPSVQRSLSGKSGSLNGAVNAASSKVSLSVAKQPKPDKTAPMLKGDEDARSTTSSNASGQRRSESGFSFRLNERAEKRKEFFSKLEEKMQAKEAEKTNIQAKTMENQEAEIKQLRKSLTFKATPMPTFYKEPPAKVELKKIPTTRPKSPKLGRNKSFTTTKPNVLEGGESCLSPRLKQNECQSNEAIEAKSTKDASALKKPVKKSLKLQSHKHTPEKEGKKAVNADKETTTAEDTKSGVEKIEEHENKPVKTCEIKDKVTDEFACDLEVQAAEVAVEG